MMLAATIAVGIATLEELDFASVLWLLVGAFVLHEAEEWNITAFERSHFVDVPPQVTEENGRAWLIFICVVAAAWCAAAVLPGSPKLAAFVFLPAVGLTMANALQHVFWTVYFKTYAPGVVSAVLLLLPLTAYVFARASHQALVPLWYLLGIGLVIAVVVGNTVRSGRRMSAPIRTIYAVGAWILRGRALVRGQLRGRV